MKRSSLVKRLVSQGVIAVVRAKDCDEAENIVNALVLGGVKGIEVTFTIPQAQNVLSNLSKIYTDDESVIIGAGTVLDEVTARIAILSGAKFIVSPCFDQNIAKLCNLYQIPYLPGCETITEMKQALEYGCDIVKLFPGSVFGPSYIKAIKAPLPHIEIMPTGGVNIDNMKEWFDNGAICVGAGGNLVKVDSDNDFTKITSVAKQWISKFNEIQNSLK